MSPKKLTPKDKQEILDLYRNTPETTSTLAERFGVSSSTVSRFLKTSLSEDDYEVLIQQKRLARVPKAESQLALSLESTTEPSAEVVSEKETISPMPEIIEVVKSSTPNIEKDAEPLVQVKTRKRRSTAKTESPVEIVTEKASPLVTANDEPLSVEPSISSKLILKADIPTVSETATIAEIPTSLQAPALQPIALSNADLGELVAELGKLPKLEELEDLDEDLEDEDEDEEEWEDEDDDDGTEFVPSLNDSDDLKVLPLSAAVFPSTCYLVIDRTAELIVRPLKEFAHLGKIPPEEVQQKTLPIFDNHRVARRFSNRTQRVIKVPDSNILRKTSSYLKAKGITRIFLDGQVYSLASN